MLISVLIVKDFYVIERKNVNVNRKLTGLKQFNTRAKLGGGSSDYKIISAN